MANLIKFTRSERGNIAIMTAVMMPLVVSAAAFGAETTYWYHSQLELQHAADKAAYAAALEKKAGSNFSTIEAAAAATAIANGYHPGTLVIQMPPTTGTHQNSSSVEVDLTQSIPRYFTAIFENDPVVEQARAVASTQTASKACILALHPNASRAAQFSGSSDVTFNNCIVMSNSSASDAVRVQGAAKVHVDCFATVGDVYMTSGAYLTCASPITHTSAAADPYLGLAEPTATGSCKSDSGSSLSPGRYCSGMTLKNTVTLQPGTYYISGGDFKVNANANVTGNGVTLYLASGSRVSMNGNTTVKLSAPTSGTYSGILFYGARTGSVSSNTFNGGAASRFTGAIYFPNGDVTYNGNFAGNGGCTQIVARTIDWTGNTTINQNCSAYGMSDIPATQTVQLVE
jgi:Flp pilus assembly protein TadG